MHPENENNFCINCWNLLKYKHIHITSVLLFHFSILTHHLSCLLCSGRNSIKDRWNVMHVDISFCCIPYSSSISSMNGIFSNKFDDMNVNWVKPIWCLLSFFPKSFLVGLYLFVKNLSSKKKNEKTYAC